MLKILITTKDNDVGVTKIDFDVEKENATGQELMAAVTILSEMGTRLFAHKLHVNIYTKEEKDK